MKAAARRAWPQVAAFASAVDANLDAWLSDHYRIGLSEYRALTLIREAEHKELRITELAQQVGLTSTSTTRLVTRLEAKGHARRDVCEDDGRGVFAVIDASGEALLRKINTAFEARVEDLLSNPTKFFPDIDKRLLSSALSEVSTAVGS